MNLEGEEFPVGEEDVTDIDEATFVPTPSTGALPNAAPHAIARITTPTKSRTRMVTPPSTHRKTRAAAKMHPGQTSPSMSRPVPARAVEDKPATSYEGWQVGKAHFGKAAPMRGKKREADVLEKADGGKRTRIEGIAGGAGGV